MYPGSTELIFTILETVSATRGAKINMTAKLKNAAHKTANRGDSTRVETTVAIVVGAWMLVEKAAARVFIRAERFGKYPGKVKPLSGINTQGKWSG